VEDQGTVESKSGMDRRRFIKSAATVAWATPLILTMTAGRASAQTLPSLFPCVNSPSGTGCPCSVSADCTSGCCCGGGPFSLACAPDQATCEADPPDGFGGTCAA
jgi:hypothetical protein